MAAGEEVEATIEPDTGAQEIEAPEDLSAALTVDSQAKDFFATVTASQREEWVRRITSAKQGATRGRRLPRGPVGVRVSSQGGAGDPERSGGLPRHGVDEPARFAFIDGEKAHHDITVLCRLLDVNRSGHHAWRSRPPSPRAVADEVLTTQIEVAFEDNRRVPRAARTAAAWCEGFRSCDRPR